jgi:hypothetical protein
VDCQLIKNDKQAKQLRSRDLSCFFGAKIRYGKDIKNIENKMMYEKIKSVNRCSKQLWISNIRGEWQKALLNVCGGRQPVQLVQPIAGSLMQAESLLLSNR